MTYFLGIDGGGSSCRMRLVNDAGIILSECKSGSTNLFLGSETVLKNIDDLYSEYFVTG